MTVQLTRRALFESAALAALVPSAQNVFAETDPKAEADWTGYTFCDSCNHGPPTASKTGPKTPTISSARRAGRRSSASTTRTASSTR